MPAANLYETLGVARDASEKEIKSAYRALARRAHPDVGGDGDEFKTIATAYNCLMDPEKRKHYDTFGEIDEGDHPALVFLISLFNDLVLEALNGRIRFEEWDLISALKERIKRSPEQLHAAITENERRARELKKAAVRLKAKQGEDNQLAKVLLKPVAELEAAAKESRSKLAQLEQRIIPEALEILAKYNYEYVSAFTGPGWKFQTINGSTIGWAQFDARRGS